MYRGVSLVLALIVGMGGASFLYSLLAPQAQQQTELADAIELEETALTDGNDGQSQLEADQADASQGSSDQAELQSDETASTSSDPIAEPELAGTDGEIASDQTGLDQSEFDQPALDQPALDQPALDIVRVEPSGNTLIAGIADPSSRIGLLYNGDVIAEVDAEQSGDFVLAPDVPLPPGDGTLRIAIIGDDGDPLAFAEEEVAVVVPQSESSDGFLVGILRPGQPIQILEREAPQSEDNPQSGSALQEGVASAPADTETADPGAEVLASTGDGEQTATGAEVAAELASNAPDGADTTPVEPASPLETALVQDTDADQNAAVPEQPQDGPVETGQDQASVISEEETAASQEAGDTTDTDLLEGSGATSGGSALAASSGGSASPQGESAAEDAVASQASDTLEELGTAQESSTTQTADAPGEAAQTASTDTRVPEGDDPQEVAGGGSEGSQIEESQPEASQPQPVLEIAAVESQATADATPPPSVVIDAIELEGNRIWIAGAASAGAIVRLYQDNALMGEARSGPQGRFLYEGQLTDPGAEVTIRADLLAEGSADVVARAQVPFAMPGAAPAPREERLDIAQSEAPASQQGNADSAAIASTETTGSGSVDPESEEPAVAASGADADPVSQAPASETAEAEPVSQAPSQAVEVARPAASTSAQATQATPAPQRIAVLDMGRVIIRRGDNLWTLSRRVFGQGIRYTAIYDANRDQIGDPALIFPGQVFDVPEPDEEWGNVPGLQALDPEQIAPQ